MLNAIMENTILDLKSELVKTERLESLVRDKKSELNNKVLIKEEGWFFKQKVIDILVHTYEAKKLCLREGYICDANDKIYLSVKVKRNGDTRFRIKYEIFEEDGGSLVVSEEPLTEKNLKKTGLEPFGLLEYIALLTKN